jgi:pilus assembly protein CpaB
MNTRPVLVGVVLAILGLVLQIVYMRRFEADASGGAKIELLVAAAPIDRGKRITPEMLGVRAVPQAYVDDRAIRAVDRDKILDLRAVTKVPVLQTLAWTDLIATTDDQRDLSSLVQPGNRAMPVRVQFEEALQLIRPGDFVDILTVDGDGRKTSVLLQRVLVLAAGLDTTIERSTDRKPNVRSSLLTLSVSLQEAQLLTLAQSAGRLTVIVRGASDPSVYESPPDLTHSELYDANAREAVQRASRRPTRLRGD